MRLAVLRPQPDAERTADALRRMGHDAVVAPLLRMTPLPDVQLGSQWAAILISSANAMRALAAHSALPPLLGSRVLAVGDHTAESARAAGFTNVISADGQAGDLATLATAQLGGTKQSILYIAGEDRAFDFAEALAPHGIRVKTVVVYRMEAERQFPADFAEALRIGSIDGVLHYSVRSVATYLQCAADADLRPAALAPRQFCLSEQVAVPIVAAGAAQVRVAHRPEEASLFRLLDAD